MLTINSIQAVKFLLSYSKESTKDKYSNMTKHLKKCPESLLDHHIINVQIFSNQVMQSFITSEMEITNMSAQKQRPFQAATSPFL